jgi:hypothetical protein
MNIRQRLPGFAVMAATWIVWPLIGLSVGGPAVALERVISLIRHSDDIRGLRTQVLASIQSVSTFITRTCRFEVQ